MARHDPYERDGAGFIPAEAGDLPDGRPTVLPVLPVGPGRVWALALLASLIAALAGWSASELACSLVHWDARGLAEPVPARPLAADMLQGLMGAAQDRAEARNGSVMLGALGALYGVFLGLGGGCSRASKRSALIAGGLGLALGLIVGVILPFLVYPLFFRSRLRPPNPMLPLLVQAAMYGSVAAMAGLAFGHGHSGPLGAARGACAAAMGSIVGIMFYNLVHTLWFPMEWDFAPLPVYPLSRLLALLSVALVAGVCVAAVLARSVSIDSQEKEPAGD